MRVLITGSGGFIGRALKEFLKADYELLTPRSSELDLCNLNAVKKYFSSNKIDFIIHCASIGGVRGVEDKDTTVQDNLKMLNNLILCKEKDVKIITFGSGAMYDRKRNLHKVKEDEIGEFIPNELYGLSKLMMSDIAKERKDLLMLNIFACYGIGEKESRFPSYAIHQAVKNLPIEINQNVIFDYLYVEDMVKIVKHFIEHFSKDKIINITPNKSISLKEIAETIRKISNKNLHIIVKNSKMNYEYTGDNSILLKNIPNFEFTPIEIGLKNMYEHNRERSNV